MNVLFKSVLFRLVHIFMKKNTNNTKKYEKIVDMNRNFLTLNVFTYVWRWTIVSHFWGIFNTFYLIMAYTKRSIYLTSSHNSFTPAEISEYLASLDFKSGHCAIYNFLDKCYRSMSC